MRLHYVKIVIVFASYFLLLSWSSLSQMMYDNDGSHSTIAQQFSTYDLDFHVYSLNYYEVDSNVSNGFISLSELYFDTLEVIRNVVKNQKEMNINDLEYIPIIGSYREKFLDKMNLNESDTIYVYDYLLNVLSTFPIHSLETAAILSPYAYAGDELYDSEYMIGFMIDQEQLAISSKGYFRHSICYIGKENPFSVVPLAVMDWQLTSMQNIPTKLLSQANYINQDAAIYSYTVDTITCYIQEQRNLLVVDNRTNSVIFQKQFDLGEGDDFVPLQFKSNFDLRQNGQRIGYLFKDRPMVVIDFLYRSFGCPAITYLDPRYEDQYIYCDNRH